MSLYFANQVPYVNIYVNTETPEYKWIYQRTTDSQQRKQKTIFLALRKEKKLPVCEILEFFNSM